MKKLAILLACTLLITLLISGTAANEPVVTRSYVDGVFEPQVRQATNNAVQSAFTSERARLFAQLDSLENILDNQDDSALAARASNSILRGVLRRTSMMPVHATRRTTTPLPNHMTIALAAGSTIMLVSGTATLTTTAVNLTTGQEQAAGTPMLVNHLYLTLNGGRFANGDNAVFRVDGIFRIETTYQAQFTQHASALRHLGIFLGGTNGFELNRHLTREEAAVLLIRFLGLEQTAIDADLPNPWSDRLQRWARPHAALANQRGYIFGMGGLMYGQFGVGRTISVEEFTMMLLRVFGYTHDGDGFSWRRSPEFAASIGLFTNEEVALFREPNVEPFMRDHVAYLYFHALTFEIRGEGITLLDRLIADGVVTQQQADEALEMVTMPRIGG